MTLKNIRLRERARGFSCSSCSRFWIFFESHGNEVFKSFFCFPFIIETFHFAAALPYFLCIVLALFYLGTNWCLALVRTNWHLLNIRHSALIFGLETVYFYSDIKFDNF